MEIHYEIPRERVHEEHHDVSFSIVTGTNGEALLPTARGTTVLNSLNSEVLYEGVLRGHPLTVHRVERELYIQLLGTDPDARVRWHLNGFEHSVDEVRSRRSCIEILFVRGAIRFDIFPRSNVLRHLRRALGLGAQESCIVELESRTGELLLTVDSSTCPAPVVFRL